MVDSERQPTPSNASQTGVCWTVCKFSKVCKFSARIFKCAFFKNFRATLIFSISNLVSHLSHDVSTLFYLQSQRH